MSNIEIRNCKYNEMPLLCRFSSYFGRNPGLNDPDFIYVFDPEGFIVALNENALVGSISAVRHGEKKGFIGFHIVTEEYIPTELAQKLLELAMKILNGRSVQLNSFEVNLDLYKSFGFEVRKKIISYKCSEKKEHVMHPDVISPLLQPAEQIVNSFKQYYPETRHDLFWNWLNQPQSMLLGQKEGDRYSAFGLYYPCINGFRLGPVCAEDPVSAKNVLTSLLSFIPKGSEIFIDIPESDALLIKAVEEEGFTASGYYFRMQQGGDNSLWPLNGQSSINFELN